MIDDDEGLLWQLATEVMLKNVGKLRSDGGIEYDADTILSDPDIGPLFKKCLDRGLIERPH